jgi:hypothetical protein
VAGTAGGGAAGAGVLSAGAAAGCAAVGVNIGGLFETPWLCRAASGSNPSDQVKTWQLEHACRLPAIRGEQETRGRRAAALGSKVGRDELTGWNGPGTTGPAGGTMLADQFRGRSLDRQRLRPARIDCSSTRTRGPVGPKPRGGAPRGHALHLAVALSAINNHRGRQARRTSAPWARRQSLRRRAASAHANHLLEAATVVEAPHHAGRFAGSDPPRASTATYLAKSGRSGPAGPPPRRARHSVQRVEARSPACRPAARRPARSGCFGRNRGATAGPLAAISSSPPVCRDRRGLAVAGRHPPAWCQQLVEIPLAACLPGGTRAPPGELVDLSWVADVERAWRAPAAAFWSAVAARRRTPGRERARGRARHRRRLPSAPT